MAKAMGYVGQLHLSSVCGKQNEISMNHECETLIKKSVSGLKKAVSF